MDGGRILRAILWPLLGWRRATLGATSVAMVCGAGFIAFSLQDNGYSMILALIGVFVIFSSYREFQQAKGFRPLPPKR